MAKPPRPYHERIRSDVIGIYVSGAVLVLGIFVFSQYTEGWTWSLGSPSIWALIGWSVLAGSFVVWGLSSSFRQRTRKLFSGNYVFEYPHVDVIRVTTRHYIIDEEATKQQMSSTDVPDIRKAIEYQKGRVSGSTEVAVSVYAVGGIDAHGFHSIDIGKQGYIVSHGELEIIKLSGCYFIPHDLELMDHSEVAPEVITAIKNTKNAIYVENETPIFGIGPLDAGIERWLSCSPRAQSIVLRSIGYETLAMNFARRLEGIVLVDDSVGTALETVRNSWNRNARDSVRKSCEEWLRGQESLTVAMQNGEAGIDYWRSDAVQMRSALTEAQATIAVLRDTNWKHERASNDRSGRGYRIGGGNSAGTPMGHLQGRLPSTDREE